MDYEAECGCEYVEWGDKGAIRFCPLHDAARELLVLLLEALDKVSLGRTLRGRIETVISKAIV